MIRKGQAKWVGKGEVERQLRLIAAVFSPLRMTDEKWFSISLALLFKVLSIELKRGMVEVGCFAHARRHFHNALDNDPARMRTVLLLIAQLYAVEKIAQAKKVRGEALRLAREQGSRPVLDKLHAYLLEIRKHHMNTTGGEESRAA
jgi:hypothetical protein